MPQERLRSRSRKAKETEEKLISTNKTFRNQFNILNNLIGQSQLSLYGTDRKSDVDDLNQQFQQILDKQIGDITNHQNEDITSFLNQVVSTDNKSTALDEVLMNQFTGVGGDYSSLQSFIYDAYRNKMLEQSDLHEIASNLIELSEAINITRDAIISADVVEGRMNRSLNFKNLDDDIVSNAKSITETIEKKFNLLEKVKDFIIPKTLEYGEYYAYVIPYSKIFDELLNSKLTDQYGRRIYRESTILESFRETSKKKKRAKDESIDVFLERVYKDYTRIEQTSENAVKSVSKEEFKKDLKNIMENISIVQDPVPIPIIEEGFDSIEYYKTEYLSEKKKDNTYKNIFNEINKGKKKQQKASEGIVGEFKSGVDFSDINDCYIKLIEPTRIIPIKIMNTTLGYCYIQDEDITPLSGAISNTLYFTKFDEHNRNKTVIDSLAERVVKAFDKDFLKNNIKFKEAIVDCFNYYNLNEKQLKFQFIPFDYIQEFKIDKDENGNGRSMIKKSLFYAKLYLLILLFKIMSILINSNDMKVNYIRQSGIDKDLANKIQEIARIKQSRQINITDLFSYTTLINKVGNGNEMYVPVGRSGERPIEMDVLAGQDVQLNSELLEMLKNAYILATGVPAAIVNYLSEAEFAKVVEQNNSKYNARVINYQIDMNGTITSFYKKIMRSSTNLDDNVIESFSFVLQPPKTSTITVKGDLLNQFNQFVEAILPIFYPDVNSIQDSEAQEMIQNEIREFKKLIIEDQLPMLNIDKLNEFTKKAKLQAIENQLKPDPNNGDNGDDDGLNDINNIEL